MLKLLTEINVTNTACDPRAIFWSGCCMYLNILLLRNTTDVELVRLKQQCLDFIKQLVQKTL
jgi:hypothetical protein